MPFEDIKSLIDEIPNYIQYIYPGYITIYLYYFFRGLTLKDGKNVIVKSIAISYIYIIFLNNMIKVQYSSLGYNIWLIVIGILVAYVSYFLIECEKIANLLGKINIATSTKLNEIEAVLDSSSGNKAWLKIYLKEDNVIYEGSLFKFELESDRRCFVMLSGYRKYQVESDKSEKLLIDFKFQNKERVIIYSEDIKCIESICIDRIKSEAIMNVLEKDELIMHSLYKSSSKIAYGDIAKTFEGQYPGITEKQIEVIIRKREMQNAAYVLIEKTDIEI